MVTSEDLKSLGKVRPTLLAMAAIAAFWGGDALSQWVYYGPEAEFSVWGLQSLLARTLVLMAGVLAGCLLLRRVWLLPMAISAIFGMAAIVNPLIWAWHGSLDHSLSQRVLLMVFLAQFLPGALLLPWLLRRRGLSPALSILPMFGLIIAHATVERRLPSEALFYVDDGDSDYVEIDLEALYAAQEGLMQGQIDALSPQAAGVPETYALLLGGTAYQSVFHSEVEKVGPILDAALGTGGRQIALVNSETAAFDYPMANRANLRRGLKALAERMGPEDMAFLFLTSHGGKDLFSLSFWQAQTGNLSAPEFAEMLDDSGIGPAVIVLSACYSGSFIDEIARPDRLIITAAAADRTSFGCADGRDWTEFGQSFFDLALRQEADPRHAFQIAAKDVASKEFWRFSKRSLPQMAEGESIGPVIDAVIAARPPQEQEVSTRMD